MTVLSMAMAIALATTAYVVLRWPRFRCFGDTPTPEGHISLHTVHLGTGRWTHHVSPD